MKVTGHRSGAYGPCLLVLFSKPLRGL